MVLEGIVTKVRESVRDFWDFVLVVVGNASASAIVETIRSWLPEQTKGLTDEALAAIVGFLMFYFGDKLHRRLVPFGFGVFLAGVGALASGYVSGLFEMFKKK
jgi:uncharacterized protein (DUF697 family)